MPPTNRTPRENGPVTLKEVAAAAGVSTASASVVLNGRDEAVGISATTRATVLETAARLGYRPNEAARSLRRRRTEVLALLVSSLSNPYFSDIAAGARVAAEERDYELDVVDVGAVTTAVRTLHHLRSGRADGIIIATGQRVLADPVTTPLQELVGRGMPMVMALGYSPGPSIPAVRMDDEEGAYLATTHLLGLGHTRIAHLTACSDDLLDDDSLPTAAHERFRGYRRALADAGVAFDPAWLVQDNVPRLDGESAVRILLDRPHPRPTAAFVFNDLMAFGVLRALRHAGLSVPGDMAVVGCDGIDFGRYTTPELSTVEHPRAELGRRAVEALFSLLDGAPGQPDEGDIVLPVRVLVRESCGAARTSTEPT